MPQLGERLRDLQLELGIGSDQSRATRGALWYVRHQASGSTPFLFDDIYAENELYGQFTLGLGQDWSLDSYARLDLDESRLRQWQIGVYRRLHCLTWGLRWDRAGETLSLEVNVNGLTGDTLPYDSRHGRRGTAAAPHGASRRSRSADEAGGEGLTSVPPDR